ncbi:hypothetical protein AAFC00_007054 [Neodothiora populina]|uniref:non-specific serine/threonine protein kinase n=1 Tax=Neodothiora populina TaxID=2781224 RepID=A0ABR3PC19_9PEZI
MSTTFSNYVLDFLWQITNCFNCFPSNPALKINGRQYKILRLLGEGGFSYVYLVQSPPSPQLHALKKIRCPFGQESVSQALKEVEAYSLFAPHPNIIQSIDHAVASDSRSDPSSKTVYILLPYYRRGNLQDAINANLVNGGRFPERRLMVLFRGVCEGLKAMHQYRVPEGSGKGKKAKSKARRVRDEGARADREAANAADGVDDDEAGVPLMDDEVTRAQEGVGEGEIRAYAHRDIKPANIMISDDGLTPILMDLGSLAPSPTPITSRALALQVQDQAAEHSTMPYRAPELFDVKTGSVVDTAVDVWSAGCTLFACLVGKSPFEMRSEETGGSLSLCVLGGDWRFPDEEPVIGGPASASSPPRRKKTKGKQRMNVAPSEVAAGGGADGEYAGADEISEAVRDVVRACLRVEASERPDVDRLIDMVDHVIAGLPDDGPLSD